VTARVEAVISDFGGVLTTPLFESFARLQESHGIPLEAIGRAMQAITERDGENPIHVLERGESTEAEFLDDLGGALEAQLGHAVAMHGFAEAYFAGLETNHAMLDWLRTARDERGVRLALLTNNVREWEPRWRAMLPPVDELFEVIVDSAFVGLRKPDPRIYEITLERLGLPGPACAFVDDLGHNCEAAAALGLRAVWFRDTDQAIAELDALLGG
jgi:epoxide hydrolase-like predicted phosphatase